MFAQNSNLNEFQFQYGSIKRAIRSQLPNQKLEFQFQYGSIKSMEVDQLIDVSPDFNSNMVRLKG